MSMPVYKCYAGSVFPETCMRRWSVMASLALAFLSALALAQAQGPTDWPGLAVLSLE